jgi:hypothetical protein
MHRVELQIIGGTTYRAAPPAFLKEFSPGDLQN